MSGRLIAALAAIVCLVGSACSGGNQAALGAKPVSRTTPPVTAASPSPSPLPAASPTPTDDCATLSGISGPLSDQGTQTVTGSKVEIAIAGFHSASGAFSFSPTCVKVARGKALTVTLTNTDQDLHNFSITALHIDRDVPDGKSITLHIALKGTKPVLFFCKYHADMGQQGAFLPSA